VDLASSGCRSFRNPQDMEHFGTVLLVDDSTLILKTTNRMLEKVA
jgi:hypothetical protein